MEASSATKGFFQTPPTIPPQYVEDAAFRRIISLYLPSPIPSSIDEDLSRFSRLVLSRSHMAYAADAEKNQPYLRPLSTFGTENKQDPLVTSEGWRKLQYRGIEEGMVGIAYANARGSPWNNRAYQFIKLHLWTSSAALVTCPGAMTDGAAKLLGRHLNGANGSIFTEARNRLISRDPSVAWTSGQWMTERKGGSDVRGTETVARKLSTEEQNASKGVDELGCPLGPWQLDGFKWFSSATDANMTIMLARTGPDGQISAFYAPLRRRVARGAEGETELNGVRIQRLKNKLGTKALPTAELELKGMRGYLIGKEGDGVREISTILNITRVHNMSGAVGGWGRGLAISRAYAKVRIAGGRLLTELPAHVRALAREHVMYRGLLHLAHFVASLLGISEGQDSRLTQATQASILPTNAEQSGALLRLLTPMGKAQTALRSINGVRACMENLGGVGYLENEDPVFNVARIFRDVCVLSIWEGTTDIMADDLVRVMKSRQGPATLAAVGLWVASGLVIARKNSFKEEANTIQRTWEQWQKSTETKDKEQLRWEGRDLLVGLESVVCGLLLILDAARDNDPIAREIARRFVLKEQATYSSWEVEAAWDKRIVFGDDAAAIAKL
ncbi:acyl-CoA dehydrogenase [Histoplasma capsulatum G186AR]|uniref:Acyl-CoA dehydrogenase n=2 Tax=Ajellomyces capsulatus TaxID=5037 RepID=C0NBA7_AJECG|nr:acyl-CoA dehydrogenase [Histoplasma capsulatum G186AR]EEH10948.1 acyl-CoA dehydrogenase [Histoplasma capsulatum G186AR]KAG5288816.1 acyl-CoA dehydrogenase [Histoplasma capsulatum]QSS71393.1 acyl-CoA dehydrogenase [Histoplasma capsulatum G186AR]